MTLKNILGLRWVGGLWLEDADILAGVGRESKNILEFGVGGSTMVFSQTAGRVVTIDTSLKWINVVKERMALLDSHSPVEYYIDTDWPLIQASNEQYDAAFIDGLSKRRLEFALKFWPLIKPGGCLMFHDTKKQQDLLVVQDFICNNFTTIETVGYNIAASNGESSNITKITKRIEPVAIHRHRYLDMDDRPLWVWGRIEDYDISNGLYEYKG